MLIYSTRLKVKENFTQQAFANSIIKWCTSKEYPMKNIEKHFSDLTFSEIYDNQMIDVVNFESLDCIAARHTSETSKGSWTVDAILNCNKRTLSVYMDYTVTENVGALQQNRRSPWLIQQIINDGFAEDNLGLELKTKALILSEDNKESFLSALNSYNTYALPIVYLSSRSELQADSLALKLAGLAVVISDPSDILYNMDKEKYNAPIYVFLPHKMMKAEHFGNYPLHRDIIRVITDFLNSRKYDKLETWEGIHGESARQKTKEILNKLKEQEAHNDFNKAFFADLEKENNDYMEKYEQLAEDFQKLKYENERLNYKLNSYSGSGSSLILSGNENDLYPNEQKEIIIEILKDHLNKSVEDGSRRADILKSILNANSVEGIPEKLRKIIKDAFTGYTKFNCPKINNALNETGIRVIEHTGHYKINYHNDNRYTFEAAATPSDNRAGQNAASIINKLMF